MDHSPVTKIIIYESVFQREIREELNKNFKRQWLMVILNAFQHFYDKKATFSQFTHLS